MISEFNPRRNRVIGDRRQLLVAERAEKQKELMERINVGDVVTVCKTAGWRYSRRNC